MFFLTICCETRGKNQLCLPAAAEIQFAAARHYHESQDWFLRFLLLMPDHLHALVAPAPDLNLHELVGNWKRYVTGRTGIAWQKNFLIIGCAPKKAGRKKPPISVPILSAPV